MQPTGNEAIWTVVQQIWNAIPKRDVILMPKDCTEAIANKEYETQYCL